MKYKSVAVWPKGTVAFLNDVTEDEHGTKEQAEGVCKSLREKGFGGDGKIFPLETRVEEVKSQPHPSPTGAKTELEKAIERVLKATHAGYDGFNADFNAVVEAAKRTSGLEKENTFLRGLVSKANIPCAHCGLKNMAECKSGFPGCAQADDLMIGDGQFLKDLQSKLTTAEQCLTKAHAEIEGLIQKLATAEALVVEHQIREVGLRGQVSSQSADVKLIVEALQRVWDEDECGWIVGSDDRRECVKCGAAALRGNIVVHTDGCTQGFIAEALATETAKKFQA